MPGFQGRPNLCPESNGMHFFFVFGGLSIIHFERLSLVFTQSVPCFWMDYKETHSGSLSFSSAHFVPLNSLKQSLAFCTVALLKDAGKSCGFWPVQYWNRSCVVCPG